MQHFRFWPKEGRLSKLSFGFGIKNLFAVAPQLLHYKTYSETFTNICSIKKKKEKTTYVYLTFLKIKNASQNHGLHGSIKSLLHSIKINFMFPLFRKILIVLISQMLFALLNILNGHFLLENNHLIFKTLDKHINWIS